MANKNSDTEIDAEYGPLVELGHEFHRLRARVKQLEHDADISWKEDHAVVGGKWYKLVIAPMRADAVGDAVKLKLVAVNATILVIARYE